MRIEQGETMKEKLLSWESAVIISLFLLVITINRTTEGNIGIFFWGLFILTTIVLVFGGRKKDRL